MTLPLPYNCLTNPAALSQILLSRSECSLIAVIMSYYSAFSRTWNELNTPPYEYSHAKT